MPLSAHALRIAAARWVLPIPLGPASSRLFWRTGNLAANSFARRNARSRSSLGYTVKPSNAHLA